MCFISFIIIVYHSVCCLSLPLDSSGWISTNLKYTMLTREQKNKNPIFEIYLLLPVVVDVVLSRLLFSSSSFHFIFFSVLLFCRWCSSSALERYIDSTLSSLWLCLTEWIAGIRNVCVIIKYFECEKNAHKLLSIHNAATATDADGMKKRSSRWLFPKRNSFNSINITIKKEFRTGANIILGISGQNKRHSSQLGARYSWINFVTIELYRRMYGTLIVRATVTATEILLAIQWVLLLLRVFSSLFLFIIIHNPNQQSKSVEINTSQSVQIKRRWTKRRKTTSDTNQRFHCSLLCCSISVLFKQ